jgi:type I restriction enzyme S subunit
VVTGRYGTLGKVFFVNEDFWPLNTALYVQDFKGNDPRFTAYFLKSVLRGTNSDKAAVPGVNRNDLHARRVRVTRDVGQQEAVASILSAYDDLIENNRRRIQLLEQAARLLYKEWFVHLRFPGHEHVTIPDGVPEGWEKKHLSELLSTQYGFTETATDEPVGPKFLRGTDINKTYHIDWSTVPYCSDDKLDFRKYALHVDDIVVIRMADPGKVAIVESDVKAVFASYLVRLTRKEDVPSPALYSFFVLSDDLYQGFISGASGGSTRKSASAKLFVDFDALTPPASLVSLFVERVQPLRSQIRTLLEQNASLREARDLLLPRLMNGGHGEWL